MNKALPILIAILTAFFHAVCALGGVAGVALCFEADGCIQFEVDECKDSGSQVRYCSTPSTDDALHEDDCSACLDVPLEVSEAQLVEPWPVAVALADLAPLLLVIIVEPDVSAPQIDRWRTASLPEPQPLTALRRIVLRI